MAVRLLGYQVADLCLGKPPLRSLSATATIAAALSALKSSDDNFVSVWSCDHSSNLECICVGKICMVDIICYLCREENLCYPGSALESPVAQVLLAKGEGMVKHVEPSASLLDAIDLILEGAQNLVVPIKTTSSRRKHLQKSSTLHHNGQEFCWLTQEDIIQFLLGSIGLFSPIATLSISTLGIIDEGILIIDYHSPATSAIQEISQSLVEQTSVAIIDGNGTLIGEISPSTLNCSDETAAAAIATLSAGDLMAYIDGGSPPEEIMRTVRARLKERNLECMLEEFAFGSNVSSSDEELMSPTTTLPTSGRYSRAGSYSARMFKRAEAIVCHRWSSLVAVMIQAIAHRVNYVWVIEDDRSVVGIVTFRNILEVFRESVECLV